MGGRIAPRFKSVLIDLSGTLHIEDTVVPGAVGALKRLRETDLKVKFVTNTTKESKRFLYQRLENLGFSIGLDEIFTSLTAARNLVQNKNVQPHLLLDNRALEDFEGITQENPNAVVVGLAPEKFNYEDMNNAFRLVLDGAPLIAIHTSRYYRRKDGLALGPGPFVKALEFSTGTIAEVVGKPEKSFFLSAIKDLNCLPEECVLIGDDVQDDIGGAQDAGMSGILVKTGKYREGDENKINPKPHQVVEDFACAVDLIISSLK